MIGFDPLLKLLRELWYRLAGGLNPDVIRPLTEQIQRDIESHFALSRGPDGTPWKPLKYRQGKPLILSGALRAAAVAAAGSPQITEASLVVSLTEPPYAQYHQFGTRRIPARPFMGLSEEGQRQTARALEIAATAFFVNGRVD